MFSLFFICIIVFALYSNISKAEEVKIKNFNMVNKVADMMVKLDVVTHDKICKILSSKEMKLYQSVSTKMRRKSFTFKDMDNSIALVFRKITRSSTIIQFEGDLNVYNMLSENHQLKILKKLTSSQRRVFEKALKELKSKGCVSENHMDMVFQSKIIKSLKGSFDSYRKSFSNLTEISSNFNDVNIDSSRDMFRDVDQGLMTQFNVDMLNNMLHEQMQLNQDFSIQSCMNDSLRAIMPMDFGGHMGGIGFNPSETMQNEAMNMMNDSMADMSHDTGAMDMHNDMNGF